MDLISTYNIEIELTVSQRIDLASKVYPHFDIFDFGIGTDSIMTENAYHQMIDRYYPTIPRKTSITIVL